MNQRSPRPDALQTIGDQLEILCREWEHAPAINPNTDSMDQCTASFGLGQDDAWKQCARQLRSMVESIREARKEKGLYASDDWHAVVNALGLLTRRLAGLESRVIYLVNRVSSMGPPEERLVEFRRPEGMTEDEEWENYD